MFALESMSLVCRLFALGMPLYFLALSQPERRAVSTLGYALKPAPMGRLQTLCPFCHLKLGAIYATAAACRRCHCPDCGFIPVVSDDLLGVALDEAWLKRKLRLAMDISNHDGIDEISNGIWRIGNARRAPVVLARSLDHVWRDPSVLDRVRVSRGMTSVITPAARTVTSAPLGDAVQWLPLQERFALYGSGLSFIDPGTKQGKTVTDDPAMPVNGPFSGDFRWVTLAEWPHGPIRLTKGQGAIFQALWSFKGLKVDAQRLMSRAGLSSAKPIDLFKAKTKTPINAKHHGALFAYQKLVISIRREGVYWLAPDVYSKKM